MSEVAVNGIDAFEYVNLADIDPSQKNIPDGMYTLQIVKASFVRKEATSDKPAYAVVKLQFAVVDHPELSGRRIFGDFYMNDFNLKNLRRIMDATGVRQEPGQPLSAWVELLGQVQPTFKVPIGEKDSMEYLGKDANGKAIRAPKLKDDGTPEKENAINYYKVTPA
jgi:hypothetical protein